MMPQTCLYFLPTWENTYNLKNVGEFCRHISTKYQVLLVLSSKPIDKPPYGYSILPDHINGGILNSFRLALHLLKIRPALIFSYCGYNSNLVFSLLQPLLRFRTIYKADSQEPDQAPSRFRSFIRHVISKYTYRMSSLIIVESIKLVNLYSALSDSGDVRLYLNVKTNVQASSSKSTYKSRYERPYLLFPGRISFLKGIDSCISLLSYLQDIPLDILAVGPITDQFARSQIAKLNQDPVLRSRFAHIDHIGQYDKLLNYYRNAFATIITSRDEGLPNRIIDSLSVGTPIIAFDVGNVSAILNTENSVVISAGDLDSFASSIRYLYSNYHAYCNLCASTSLSYSRLAESSHSVPTLLDDKL